MEVGETWAYRERISDPNCPLVPAEILRFGPPKSHKVRIRWNGGEYEGLETWVPRVRLMVLWGKSESWLRDERLYRAVREASLDVVGTVEHRAALMAVFVHPDPDGILIGYDRSEGAILQAFDLQAMSDDLSLDARALLSEPLAFIDRDGTFVAPWPIARRIAIRVAERYPNLLLQTVADDESELQVGAVHGRYVELTRREQLYIPRERCAEDLRQKEPVFALVRSWCGSTAVQTFDEVTALRVEVSRLRMVITDTARGLDEDGRQQDARRLRKKLDARP